MSVSKKIPKSKSKSSSKTDSSKDLASRTVIDLRILAKEKGVSLTGITRKADIIKALSSVTKPKSKKPKTSASKSWKVYLKPYIDDGYGTNKTIKTGNYCTDRIVVERLKLDHNDVKSIFMDWNWDDDFKYGKVAYPVKVINYEFNGTHIILDVRYGGPKEYLECTIKQIIKMGPDTWMEGDIVILDEDEIEDTKFRDSVGLFLRFVKVVQKRSKRAPKKPKSKKSSPKKSGWATGWKWPKIF